MELKDKIHFHMFYTFWSLIDYCKIAIDNREEKIKHEYEKSVSSDTNQQERYFKAEEFHNYCFNEFTYITTNSMIINLFNAIEVFLRKLCNKIKEDKKYKVGISSFNGSIIEKVKTFYSIYNLPLIDQNIFDLFLEIQKIRDCLVHCNGIIEDSRDSKYLLEVLKDESKIRLMNGSMVVEYNYCMELLVKSKDSMVSIFNNAGYSMLDEIK